MAFDYIHDIFGKFRNRETRFNEVEKRAKNLIRKYVSDSISTKDFAKAFNEVRQEFIKLMETDGQMVIDEDTPLWLNSLLGFHFMDWYRFQQVKWYFEAHPEELHGETEERYRHLCEKDYDRRFKNTCQTVLRELNS